MDSDQASTPLDLLFKLSPKRSLGDDVTERLRQVILNGGLKPGQPLREEQLAASLDVSRGPIREALVQLEREGLVIVRRHRGATVARLLRSDVDEVYSLRRAIERLAIELAVRNATEEDFAALEGIIDAFRAAFARGPTVQEIADLDVRFHDLIYRAAHHQRLYDCWSNLRSQIYIFLLSRNVANPDFHEVTVQSHQDILEVLRTRDAEQAVIVIEEHLRGAYDRVIQSYQPVTIDRSVDL